MTEQTSPAPRPIEAHGVKGINSKPWRRTFKSQAAFEKWLDGAAAQDVTVHATRDAEG